MTFRGAFGVYIGAMISVLAITTVCSQAAPEPRTIAVDYRAVKGPRSMTWRACVGAGRVGEGMRGEWQRQLKLCRDEIGFESLRCHGLLHDELGAYREDKNGNPVYNWQYIDLVYDYLLSIGVRPFVEIGFMPDALATIPSAKAGLDGMADDPAHPGQKRRVTVFQWRSNVTPPKSWDKWDGLVAALVRHWTERYGADEVRRWNFEIWNEPNHPAFFSPNDPAHRRAEYFDLYAHTARAVKSVDAAYRVGGPAAAGPNWIPELIAYGKQNSVPIDFISFHAYGLGGGPGGFDEYGEKIQYLSPSPLAVAHTAAGQRAVIDRAGRPGLPIHVTEWSASYSARDPVHDSFFEAPFILEQLKHTETLQSMSYWTFTDIFEETGIPPRPFHGGFGLLTVQGIKKPAYFAYRFLNLLGYQELKDADERSWVCRDARGGVQVLLWDLDYPAADGISNQARFRRGDPPAARGPVHLSVTSLPPGRYHLAVYRVGFEKNDAYTAYEKMGAPAQLTRAQEDALKVAASGKPEEEKEIRVGPDKVWHGEFPLHANDVVLATLTPLGATGKGNRS